MAAFGDPHFYVFGANIDLGEFITCSLPGYTEYISNDYIEIYGFHTLIDENEPYTYITFVINCTIF